MKRFVAILIVFSMVIGLAGCGSGGSESEKTYTMKFATQTSESHAACQSMYRFKELVEERSNGRIKVEVYFGGTLGNDRDLTEGVQAGTVEAACVTVSPMAAFVPEIAALDLPFILSDWDDGFAFRHSKAADLIQEKLDSIGITAFGYISTGCRHITNNKQPINSLSDMSGMKIRVMESDMFINTFKALGAAPVPMAWAEVPTSLQQGVIEGQENPVQTIYEQGVYEYQKYLSLTGHVRAYMVNIISTDYLKSMPEDLQKIVLEAGDEATEEWMKKIQEDEEKLLEELQDKGMVVNEVDTTEFVKAVEPIYENYIAEYGDEIVNALKEITK